MNETLWHAIVNCETTFDGEFFYGVITTGIFCRPSCHSRTPIPENVRIFSSVDEALTAGFRPCKRCRPAEHRLAPHEELVQAAKQVIHQRYQEPLTLDILASELTISPYHLHRVFKRSTGITLADYVVHKRIEAAKEMICTNPQHTITDIALAVGFRSAAHFSTVFQRKTGHTPTEYREQAETQIRKGAVAK
ncbi:bifunctional transcriptional activator/DNA repair enzyme AdaA [Alicyclobacillus sp. ALC3]|uniref:bifunctional transcriptional activator/DNA repair enzyme AdaA n=1 Tax=Alicyclobacillus sp. ALC3 TaxID=2796143 RepID=UPI002379B8C2|nr:bifunctional transcriptional activator/DNA repair enzyme AdaA [Alicyclobacillus sp. ALC3]